MSDLKDTLTYILEHKRQLAGANESTTQQYVVLPILRALGWDYTNLGAMEVLPELYCHRKFGGLPISNSR